MHLQFLGHPIANDPVYQNTAAWGKDQGKGGVFGKSRGGTEEQRLARKVAGDLLLEKELAKASMEDGAAATDSAEPAVTGDATDVPASAPPAVKYNKFGRVILGNNNPLTMDTGDHEAHENALSAEAKAAIAVLRTGKDEADGQARARDTKGIQAQIRRETRAKRRELGEAVPEGERSEDEEEADDLGYCEVCFTPNVPDPKPEQLFIWLHAMRCESGAGVASGDAT